MPEGETIQQKVRRLTATQRELRGALGLVGPDGITLATDVLSVADEIPSERDSARQSYVAAQASAWNGGLRDELLRLMRAQEQETFLRSQDWQQDLVARGTINGIMLVMELYQGYEQEMRDRHDDQRNNNPGN